MGRAAWLGAGAIAGALFVQHAPGYVLLAAAGLGLLALAARMTARVALVALSIGALLIVLRGAAGLGASSPPAAALQGDPDGRDHLAVVLSIGAPSGGQQRGTIELQPPDPVQRGYVWVPRYPPVAPGDLVRLTGRLEEPPSEGGFGEYLARSGLGFTLKSRTLERIGADGSPLAALEGVRRSLAELVTRILPEPQAGLATAMAIGLRDLVARDVTDDFRTSGLSHVVAISGWHIALVGAVVSGMLGGLSRRPRSMLVLATIVAYAILAGASPGILRAAVMASVVLLARESGRRGQASAALALTCLALLLLDPASVADVGFQLSVAATAGLLIWAAQLRLWLGARLPQATPGWLLEALAVSLAAQFATMPLVLFHFGRLSLVAPLANLLIAPLVAPAMLLTALALVGGGLIALGVPTIVLAPLSLIGGLGIGAMIAIANVMAGLPFASLELPAPLNLVGAGASVMTLLWAVRRRNVPQQVVAGHAERPARASLSPHRRVGLATTGAVATLSLLLALVAFARPDGRLHVTMLDIGQGDSILLEGPSGGRVLIDTGPDPDLLLARLDARVAAWDRRIDLVVLTHPHEDHVAGLALLLDRYRIGEIVEPGMIGLGAGDAAYRRRLAELGRESRVVAAGDRLWLDGIRLDVAWPMRGSVPLRPADGGKAINNVSIVLELQFGARRMLFTGDVEQQIDPQLLAAGLAEHGGGQPLDVLKVAHHGSGTATTDAFVERLSPRVAVVSAGAGNPYGHPSPATVARLSENGAKLFRTDLDGSIEISTDGTDLIAHADGGRPRPATPAASLPRGIGFCPIPGPTYNRPNVDPISNGGRRDRARPRILATAA